MVPGLIYARREASLMTAVTYTQDTPTWCDPCSMARDECGHTPDTPRDPAAHLVANVKAWRKNGGVKEKPTILSRSDGAHLFYRGKVNALVGDSESAKTWIALGAMAKDLRRGGRGLYIDMDFNGTGEIVPRLEILGVDPAILDDPSLFRYLEISSPAEYSLVLASAKTWKPTITILDAHAAIASAHNLNDNDSGDMRKFHLDLVQPFAKNNGCVILIDHMAKNETSRDFGARGSTAKTDALTGGVYKVTRVETWEPATGGASDMHLLKDRSGGVRSVCAPVKSPAKQYAGRFRLHPPSEGRTEQAWAIYPEGRDGETSEHNDLVARIGDLSNEDRKSARAVRAVLGGRSQTVNEAYAIWVGRQKYAGDTDTPVSPPLIDEVTP